MTIVSRFVKPAVLRQFYYGHNSRSQELITQRLERVKNAVALTGDPALLAVHSLAIQTLVGQLQALRPFLDQHEQQIAELFAAHPDAALFDSLPGAGSVLAPRLLAALGSDRSRFPDAGSNGPDRPPTEATEVPLLLGDVLVCPTVAARNAPTHAGTYEDELALLVVHGVLHILGMDHADDAEAAAMQAREREHLARHGPAAGGRS